MKEILKRSICLTCSHVTFCCLTKNKNNIHCCCDYLYRFDKLLSDKNMDGDKYTM
ncbi:hypothetical protein Q2T41_12100 [Maribacter confluentis]|uniref:Uncharacterized protein n=1 Tax=Maribacter confluentis TaxID=1656093 RepID=A0ABT8RR99_9FLAO|nr:hypothetical protein [Maribacter confluentis]MDO1513399.1 hypothetical protein [Maribacter confluentis]